MRRVQTESKLTGRSVALSGAVIGVGLAFVYALAFALYAIVRSSLTLWALTPAEIGVSQTMAANGASILIAAVTTAGLFAVFTALLGMVSAILIHWLLTVFNPHAAPGRAMLVGLATACAIVLSSQVIVNLLCSWGLGRSLFSLGAETYLFWFGYPGLMYICAGALGARQLNLHRQQRPEVSTTSGTALAGQRA